jgi:hypothetical protein
MAPRYESWDQFYSAEIKHDALPPALTKNTSICTHKKLKCRMT